MTAVEIIAHARTGSSTWIDQLLCHPRLPLVAGLDARRPAVHVWDHGTGELLATGTVGGDSRAYGDGHYLASRDPEMSVVLDRRDRRPAATWHPHQPLLLVASEGTVTRWAPDGISTVDGLPAGARYRHLAFSPAGKSLWASPSPDARENPWQHCSDAIDLASGTVRAGRGWDTGVAIHPGGGLAATLRSDQGETHVIFARVDLEATPAAIRVLRRALILAADGYQTPVISRDGRHLAIRGNAYENSLEVFTFPALNRVLATVLGDAHTSKPSPQWYQQYRAWSRHNIAFGNQPGVLWLGTPAGTLAEINLDSDQVVAHDVLSGSRVTALGATATGDLIIATGEGKLVLAAVRTDLAPAHDAGHPAPQVLATDFLQATSEVPDDGVLDDHLVMTDGIQTWEPDALKKLVSATEADPMWLRHRTAINKLFAQEK